MMRVLYPGSFDPITKGHMNIVDQATLLFDEVIIAVLQNPIKKISFFTLEERLEILNKLYYNNTKIKIIASNNTATDLALEYKCKAIIRGLRSIKDFEYEKQLAEINKDISDDQVNTICLFAEEKLQTVSSSVVKEIFYLNKSISKYVDPIVEEKMIKKGENNK
ncbi:MAG: pantetheine-phosphate adenylyltransferase [Bacilli bacterium]|nr:pantetheine-phosphate adenylyltransferase [Bacilli bacterium]